MCCHFLYIWQDVNHGVSIILNLTLATIAAVQSREYTYGVECGVKLAARVISGEI